MFKSATSILISIFMLFLFVNPILADAINADRMVGIAPVTVNFNLDSDNWCYYQEWSFGDSTKSKEKNPVHVFTRPGTYHVKVVYRNSLGKFELQRENFITVYPPCGLSNLEIIERSTAWPSESWNNINDGDIEGEDAMVSAMGEPAYAIFKFSDSSTKKIKQIRLLGNAAVGTSRYQVRSAKIEISRTGINTEDFELLSNVELNEENWTEMFFEGDSARYIKLSFDSPSTELKQLSEFEVYTEFVPVDSLNSTIEASAPHEANGVDFSEITLILRDENGDPITGKTLDDVSFYISGRNNFMSDFREVAPGVYKMKLTSLTAEEKQVIAFINGVPVAYTAVDNQLKARTLFTQPPSKSAELVVVDSSDTWPREGWSKAFDGRYSGEGTYASATGNPPYVVVEFVEQNIQWINHFKIKTRADVNSENQQHWVEKLRLLVSETGMNETDFQEVLVADVPNGDWIDFNFPAVAARFIKFVIDEPIDSEWRQISEIQVTTVSAPTPVELAAFEAIKTENTVALKWVTLSESKNYGFEIQRRAEKEEYTAIGFVPGQGTTTTRNSYSFVDREIKPQICYYRLKQIDFDGSIAYSEEKVVAPGNLNSYQLGKNFPNPFNPTTTIQYLVGKAGPVKISIKNLLGQEVKELVNNKHEIGNYEVHWDATDRYGQPVASGTYIYIIEAENFHKARRMLLIR